MSDVYVSVGMKDGSVDKRWVGLLYTDVDDAGVVKELIIENEIDSEEILFDPLDPHIPEIPGLIRFDKDCFVAAPFNNPSDYTKHSRDSTERTRDRSSDPFYRARRGAQRLYERVVRGEPVLVSHEDENARSSLYHDAYGELFDSHALTLMRHPERRWIGKKRTPIKEQIPGPHRVLRTTLKSANSRLKGAPQIVIDICVQEDGFPARVEHILGFAEYENLRRYPLMIDENGEILMHGLKGRYAFGQTNIFARTMAVDQKVAFWDARFQNTVRYTITYISTLLSR